MDEPQQGLVHDIVNIITSYKKISIIIAALIISYPMIINGFLMAERYGYINDKYQADHAILIGIAKSSILTQGIMKSTLRDIKYAQEGTCLNTMPAQVDLPNIQKRCFRLPEGN